MKDLAYSWQYTFTRPSARSGIRIRIRNKNCTVGAFFHIAKLLFRTSPRTRYNVSFYKFVCFKMFHFAVVVQSM